MQRRTALLFSGSAAAALACVAAAGAAGVSACAAAARSERVPAPVSSVGVAAPDGPAVARVTEGSPDAGPGGEHGHYGQSDGGLRCGCSLCAPVVSDDPCVHDGECAPAVPCHAERCVARAKAKPASPGLVCTMDLRCHTADVNRCACHQGKCALVPRGAPGG